MRQPFSKRNTLKTNKKENLLEDTKLRAKKMAILYAILAAAKTSAFYSIVPFLGVAFSMLLLYERPSIQFYVALIIMAISTYQMVKDTSELFVGHKLADSHVGLSKKLNKTGLSS